jgi:putative nucleotide binding protein
MWIIMEKKYEEYAYVLDYLSRGRPSTGRPVFRAEPIVQVVGETYFTLLEAVVKVDATFTPNERIYVGKDSRKKIEHITGRISYDDLTSTAKSELPILIEKLVKSQEKRFVDFFNNAPAVTPRMHALELIPGIGKKYMWQILNQREQKPFESFADLQARTEIPDPAKLVTKRILEELMGESKYRLFTRVP